MDIEKYIGFKLDEIIPLLQRDNLQYEIKEVWDTKNTKLGDDLRIINIEDKGKIVIYVAYF
jgi:hypothetical protein